MKNFVIDVNQLYNILSRFTISFKDIAFLIKHDHFVKIFEVIIRNKNKVDIFVKVLILVQVS